MTVADLFFEDLFYGSGLVGGCYLFYFVLVLVLLINLHMEGFVMVLFGLFSVYVFPALKSMTEVCEGVYALVILCK